MLVQYDGYVNKTVQGLKYAEMIQDVFHGDFVIGKHGKTAIIKEPKSVRKDGWVVLEYGGNVSTIHEDTYVCMNGGKWVKAKHIKVGDTLDNKVNVRYVGHTKQFLYGTEVDTEDHTLYMNGLYIKGGNHE